MKKISTAFAISALVALSACGGGASENVAANNTAGDELYNLAPEDLGNELPANEALANETAPGNEAAPGNEVAENASGNAQ